MNFENLRHHGKSGERKAREEIYQMFYYIEIVTDRNIFEKIYISSFYVSIKNIIPLKNEGLLVL